MVDVQIYYTKGDDLVRETMQLEADDVDMLWKHGLITYVSGIAEVIDGFTPQGIRRRLEGLKLFTEKLWV
jgi:hypothetical protein